MTDRLRHGLVMCGLWASVAAVVLLLIMVIAFETTGLRIGVPAIIGVYVLGGVGVVSGILAHGARKARTAVAGGLSVIALGVLLSMWCMGGIPKQTDEATSGHASENKSSDNEASQTEAAVPAGSGTSGQPLPTEKSMRP